VGRRVASDETESALVATCFATPPVEQAASSEMSDSSGRKGRKFDPRVCMMVLAIVSQAELEAIDVAEPCRQISRLDESGTYAPRNDPVKKAARGVLPTSVTRRQNSPGPCGVVRDMPRPAGQWRDDDPANARVPWT
jgi:hypothetical protein